MGALRTKMIEEMRLRNFSPRTEQSYVSAMVGLVKYYRRVAGSTHSRCRFALICCTSKSGASRRVHATWRSRG